jgi:serine/threonine protein kinase
MATVAPSRRFQRTRRLGEGSSGVVYEALDLERGTRVALKTLRHVTAESRARLEREFRRLQGVHHRNLVTWGELVSEDGEWFFTMELVEGGDWLDHVRPKGAECFDEGRLRGALKQLAEGLSALHDAGFVHRDVKPSNVRVTDEGRVVLLDFGLVVELGADNAWTEPAAGTPAYMAPEQVVSSEVGPEADWYAMGVLLFEALTAQVPFEGAPPHVMMTRKQREEPPSPGSVAPGVPRDLDILCTELLRFGPDARMSGREVVRVLRGGGASNSTGPAAASNEPFVGRSKELGAMMAAFVDIRRGPPVTVLVEGPSGMGKSALVRRFVEQLKCEAPNAVVLAGSCVEHDGIPYRAFRDIADALVRTLGHLDPAEARSIVSSEPLALVNMFPALRRVQAIAELARGSLPPFAPPGLRARAFGLLRELLRRLGERRQVVVVIDDAHRADDDTLALLIEVMRTPEAPRLLLVLIAETSVTTAPLQGESPDEPHGRTLANLLRDGARRITLGALSSQEASALAVELLALVGGIHPGMAEHSARQSAGDPLFLDAMVRRAGAPSHRSSGASCFEDVLCNTIEELDGAARAILETVCVAEAPMPEDTLARAAAVEGLALAGCISRLAASHLVHAIGARSAQRVGPYHDRVRAVVLAQLDEPRRADVHRRIAGALETAERIDPGPLSMHWRCAGDRAQALHYAVLAADVALEVLAFDCAARCYELALSSDPGSAAARRELLVKLGNARASAGWGQRSAEAFRAAAEGAQPGEALQLRRRAAEELLMAGDIQGGAAIVREVLRRAGMWMPSSRLATVAAFLFFRAILRLRGMGCELRGESSIPRAALIRAHVCAVAARTLSSFNYPLALYFQTRMLLLALRCPEPTVLSNALVLEAAFVSAKGIRTRARVDELLTRAEGIAHESATPFAKLAAPRMRGLAAYMQGRFADGLQLNDRATGLLLEMAPDEYFAMRHTELYALWALARLGQIRELSSRLARAVREATDRHDVTTSTALRGGVFAPAWLRTGDPMAVRDGVKEAMRPWTNRPYDGHHYWTCSTLVQVDLYEGLGAQAFQRATLDFPRARRAYRFYVEINRCFTYHLRGRAAVLAAAQTDPSARAERRRLLASAARDAQLLRRAPPVYASPWGALVDAGIADVKGQRSRAMSALEEAIVGLDAAEDRLTAAAARMRLGEMRGEEGRAVFEMGEAFMREQEVAEPSRMAAALVPGIRT